MENQLDSDLELGLKRENESVSGSTTNLDMENTKHFDTTTDKLAPASGVSSSATSITLNESLDQSRGSTQNLTTIKGQIQPNKKGAKRTTGRLNQLLHHDFTIYRRIFAVVFIANLTALIAFLVQASGSPSSTTVSSAAAINLAFSVIFRQEQVVNAIFQICTSIPTSWPFIIRRHAARVYHYAGFHSGCGVAAVAWYLLYTALATKEYVAVPSSESLEALVTAWILVAMFCLLLVGAHPAVRAKFHNNFEIFHRFAGWNVLAIFWAHVIFTASKAAAETSTTMGMALVQSVSFWCTIVATLPVITSWAQLRRRAVRAEKLSDHATRLHFDYRDLQTCQVVRYSSNPLLEWHSFATIPNVGPACPNKDKQESSSTSDSNKAGYSVVVSNAGDWTQKVIQNAPSHLWTRGSPYSGVTCTARLFKRVVIVATGSGIGPCLSVFLSSKVPNPRVFWSTPNPFQTFGEGIVASVKAADPDAVIWDTKVKGRPDLVSECAKLYEESGAEAIICISNPTVCKLLVNGLEDKGIPAYAPIFDS